MKKINWKLLTSILSIGFLITAGVLIGINWDYLVNTFDNMGLTISFLISILLNAITVLNNAVSIIIKVFVVKNERKKAEHMRKNDVIKHKITQLIYNTNINDYKKVELIKEFLKNEN